MIDILGTIIITLLLLLIMVANALTAGWFYLLAAIFGLGIVFATRVSNLAAKPLPGSDIKAGLSPSDSSEHSAMPARAEG